MSTDDHTDLLARLRADARLIAPAAPGLEERILAHVQAAPAPLRFPRWRQALAAGLILATAGGLWVAAHPPSPPPVASTTVALPTAPAPDVAALLALVDRPWQQELDRLNADRQHLSAWANEAMGGTVRAVLGLGRP